MIDFQSSAIARCPSHLTDIPPLPAGEGRGEGESFEMEFRVAGEGELYSRGRQSALIKVGEHGTRPYSRAVPFGHSVHSVQIPVLEFVAIRVIRVKVPIPVRATPTYCNLIQPIYGPPSPSALPNSRLPIYASITSIYTYLHSIAPICTFFLEKKDCLFLGMDGLGYGSSERINPNQPSLTNLTAPIPTPTGQKHSRRPGNCVPFFLFPFSFLQLYFPAI
jgi:hypothetical protein